MTQIALSPLIRSGLSLMRAGRWDDATQLLAAARADTTEERLALAAALAEVAVDQDFAQQTDHADARLAALAEALSETPDALIGWDFTLLQLRQEYGSALQDRHPAPNSAPDLESASESASGANADAAVGVGQGAGQRLDFGAGQGAGQGLDFGADLGADLGADQRDGLGAGLGAGQGADLAERANQLAKTAPDDSRSGHAHFYAGVIADNLLEQPEAAFAAYTTALDLGERSGDDLLISLALRHLGDHAHTSGDLALARVHWERSTELRQKVGHLLGALAQQVLLAVLARDEGNVTASKALATEVNRWSHQAAIPWLQAQSADLMN
ncbi:hypothetical protein [Kribbella sp. NPDC051620]|uniref:hypothetical protein n=1 Tax=Kribbella sp. NPDC051620 TaxID=3364120 RepID=UPI00378DA419